MLLQVMRPKITRNPKLESGLFWKLDSPKFDPHGEPIVDVNGNISYKKRAALTEMKEGLTITIAAVTEDQSHFFDHLNAKELQIGDRVKILRGSYLMVSSIVQLKSLKEAVLSHQVAERILVM